jgi:recombinational DNA repair protein (RecF pathway)
MLFADARSVREERSRQRYALQDFSRVRVSLVKGKAGWKIGSVEALENFYQRAVTREERGRVVAIIRFVRRFCHGESIDPTLYDQVITALTLCHQSTNLPAYFMRLVEVKLLILLGYVAVPAETEWGTKPLSECLQVTCTDATLKELEKLYTAAVGASQL